MGVWGVVLAWMVFWGLVGIVVGDWVFIDSVERVVIVDEVIAVGSDARI